VSSADARASVVRRIASSPSAQATLLGLVLAAVAWARLDATTRGTVWAEDGVVFLAERRGLGPWDSILHVYAGYLQVGPRLLSDVAGVVAPVELYAVTVTALCCLTLGAIGALVLVCTRGLVDSLVVRVALASVTVLVPAGPIETTGNLANLHWYALWLAPWLLLARPGRWVTAAALGVVALLAGLTEIQVALFLPLVLLRLRDRRAWPAAAGLALGVAAQVVASINHPRPRPTDDVPGLVDLAKGFLLNVVVPIWTPSVDGPGSPFADHGWWLALLMAVPFVLAGAALLVVTATSLVRRRSIDDRTTVFAAAALGVVVPFVAAIVLNPSSRLAYDSFTVAELSERFPLRYGVVPAMFLIATLLLWIDAWLRRPERWRVVTATVLVVGVGGLLLWHVAPDGTRRSEGPGWRAGVAAAQAACRAGEVPAPVAAAPKQDWAVVLDCPLLLDE